MTINPSAPAALRHEQKHQISLREDLVLSQRLRKLFPHDKHAQADGRYLVTSLYFDTPYDSALREKSTGSAGAKNSACGITVPRLPLSGWRKNSRKPACAGKRSTRLTSEQAGRLLAGEYGFLLESGDPLCIEFYSKLQGKGLRPKTIVRYEREAFLYAPGRVRITLDRDVRTGLGSLDFLQPEGPRLRALDNVTVLEVKYGAFLPDLVRMAVQVPGRQAAALLQIRRMPAVRLSPK